MDKKKRAALSKFFEAPVPVKKRQFFRELGLQPMRTGQILWVQFSHISKWSWIMAAVLLSVMLYLNCFGGSVTGGRVWGEKEWLGLILAFMPFLAVACVSESVRSSLYGMEELEMSARFSLRSIILVRMGIVGLENLLLALAAVFFVGGNFLQTVVYLLVPYLMTTYGSFILVRRRRDGEEIYLCAGLAVAVSAVMLLSTVGWSWMYQQSFFAVWVIAALALAWLTFLESRRTLLLAESIG